MIPDPSQEMVDDEIRNRPAEPAARILIGTEMLTGKYPTRAGLGVDRLKTVEGADHTRQDFRRDVEVERP